MNINSLLNKSIYGINIHSKNIYDIFLQLYNNEFKNQVFELMCAKVAGTLSIEILYRKKIDKNNYDNFIKNIIIWLTNDYVSCSDDYVSCSDDIFGIIIHNYMVVRDLAYCL